MSLKWRLATTLAVLVAAAVGVANVVSYVGARSELRDQVDSFLVDRADEVASGNRFTPDVPLGGAPFGANGFGGQGSGGQDGQGGPPGGGSGRPAVEADAAIQILDADGEAVAASGAEVVLPVDDTDVEVASGGQTHLRDVTVDDVHYRMITTPLPDGGAVQVARTLTEEDDVLSSMATRLLLATVLGAAAAGVIGWLVAVRLTRPLRQLADVAEEVAQTQVFTNPIDIDRNDEVGRLATSFNAMLAALETSKRQQQRLVQDASHELRTPLTSLRTSIEVLDRATDLSTADARRLLDRATFELAELTEMVTELVDLATDAATDEAMTEVDLAEVVADVVEQARRRTGRTIELTAVPSVVEGRPTALTRAVRNIVGNATKFAPPDQPIEVEVGGGRVEVRDHGPGIPAEDRERIFDRFYRSVATRTQPGSGLGLAIVAQVVEGHGGQVWAREAGGGGAAVGFQLPAG
jgi:two-component system sensor histidine kinase MprB